MEFTQIPHLKQKVSRVALGTWSIGGWLWGGSDDAESIATIHSAFDRGINFIDTAPVYGQGHCEEIVGQALKKYGKRDQIVLATKVGLTMENHGAFRDCRKHVIVKELETSLKRLQVDYIDLYLVHWPDRLTPFAETAEVLHEFLNQGKIRAVGVSNFSVEQMEAFQKGGAIHVLQSPYNLFERAIENKELAYCLEKGIATMGYSPLCRGMLTGKMSRTREFQGDDLRKTTDPKFQEPRFSQYLQCVEKLQQWVKEKHKRSILALAVRWVLDKGVSTALWGARKRAQLTELDTVWGWKLTAQDFQEIDRILETTILDPVGPEFMEPSYRQ
jgi:aryl-alcohol dehydrogenase-like predicted oxidoreductase